MTAEIALWIRLQIGFLPIHKWGSLIKHALSTDGVDKHGELME